MNAVDLMISCFFKYPVDVKKEGIELQWNGAMELCDECDI